MKKIGIGILGLGGRGLYFGKMHFGNHPECRLVALCDLRGDRLKYAAKELGDIPSYTSVEEFLKNPDLDAVIVATPDYAHAENGRQVLAAGKHLFLEKPMAQTIEDCDSLIRAWDQSGVVFMVGLELRYCTLFKDMKKLISGGEIGKIIIGSVIDNVSVGGNYYYHGDRRKSSYIKSLILEKGTHSLDITNWLIDSRPANVFSTGGLDVFGGNESNSKQCSQCDKKNICPYFIDVSGFTMDYGVTIKPKDYCVYAQECDVDDNSLMVIQYDSGARISYMECHFTPEYSREFMFIGDRGKLIGFYNNEMEFKITVSKRHSRKQDVYFPEKGIGEHGGGDIEIVKAFIEKVKTGSSSMEGVLGARDSAAIAIAAVESSSSGKAVEIPSAPAAGNIRR
jgi:predicted dehydrogenase